MSSWSISWIIQCQTKCFNILRGLKLKGDKVTFKFKYLTRCKIGIINTRISQRIGNWLRHFVKTDVHIRKENCPGDAEEFSIVSEISNGTDMSLSGMSVLATGDRTHTELFWTERSMEFGIKDFLFWQISLYTSRPLQPHPEIVQLPW